MASQIGRAFVLVFAPLIVTQRAYCEWKIACASTRPEIVTSVSQWSLLHRLGGASRYNSTIFAGSDTFDEVARRRTP